MTAERVLLLGATGRVGRMVLAHWPGPLQLVSQHRDPARQDGLYWPDLADPSPLLQEVATAGGFAAMIVLSGVTPATGADLGQNTSLAVAAVAAAGAAGIRRVLVASSSAVYGAGRGQPLAEEAPLAPVNAYGQAKVRMEAALAPFRAQSDICALRIGNVAGADALLLNVAKAAPDSPIRIDAFADGQGPRRSYIGAGGLARVLARLVQSPAALPEVLNLAAPAPVSMESLVQATGHPYRLTPAPPEALQHITLDCSRLALLYPFTAADSDPAVMVADWIKTRVS